MANKKNNNQIVISRVFDAPKEKVYEAWTNESEAKKWWGPKGFTAPVIEMDVRPGGKYHFCMKAPDGKPLEGKEFWSTGTYKEIEPNEKLVITDSFSDENGNIVSPKEHGLDPNFPTTSIVTVLFEETDGGTHLSIIYPVKNKKTKQVMEKTGMREGWATSLDKLEASL